MGPCPFFGLCPARSHELWPHRGQIWRTIGSKRWSAHSGSGTSSCPKWRSLSISGSCLRVTGEGRSTTDWCRSCSAVMLYWSVVVKRELSLKAKLVIYPAIYVPTLTYGHQLCVVTKRMRLRIQAVEMGFLWRWTGLSLRDTVRRMPSWCLLAEVADPGHAGEIMSLGWPGNAWCSPGQAGGGCWGEGGVGFSAWAAAPTTRPCISGRRWMD